MVLVATERAGEIEPGQVVTRFDAPEAMDSLTHRVRSVSIDGGTVEVTTRGDANATSEVWSVPVDHQVGVVVASVPFVGLPLTAVRTSTGWAVVAGVAVLGVVLVLFRPRGRRRDEPLKPADELPTGTTKSISGDRT